MALAPTILIILDGFGVAPSSPFNAISRAKTPHLTAWQQSFFYTTLHASGPAVGLPQGYIGNSQVGHLTIGAGRVIKQPVTLLNQMIDNGSFCTQPLLVEKLKKLRTTNAPLHLLSLLSDAGVHAHIQHLLAFIKVARQYGIQQIIVHLFLDGRDMSPGSCADLLKIIEEQQVTIGSLHGRFYAMDRDNNWDRTAVSYQTLVNPGTQLFSWRKVLTTHLKNNMSEEYLYPVLLQPDAYINNGDGIIFCNFRPDRARQLTHAFLDNNFIHFERKRIKPLFFIAPIPYAPNLPPDTLLEWPHVTPTLKEIISNARLSIFSIAETEKFAHITYFFDGYRQERFSNETRILIPSIKTESFADFPQMSAPAITQEVLASLQTNPADFYLINYANADMVGHSGNIPATVCAIECLDKQLALMYEQITQMNGRLIITADHGKAEIMQFSDGRVNTAHTTSRVPFYMFPNDGPNNFSIEQLADIAPLILHTLNLPIPDEMKTKSLF